MKPKYRVEAFIVPRINVIQDELSSSNEMDDVKAANKFGKNLNYPEFDEDNNKSDLKNLEEIVDDEIKSADYDIDEPIYDVPYMQAAPKTQQTCESRYKPCESSTTSSLPRIPVRTSSLTSIDERGETDGILEEFCFHGYKHGCSAPVQRPEQVSEEIFKENWLRRLESLRERESTLRDKEILLQERERLLFNKEKELRILERLINDKLKQAELYLKRSKSSQSIDSASRESTGSQRSGNSNTKSNCHQNSESANQPRKSEPTRIIDPFRYRQEESVPLSRFTSQMKQSISSLSSGNSNEERSSTKSLAASTEFARSSGGAGNHNGKSSIAGLTYSSLRCKPRPKMTYDDLDSTLSADIGDSSYIVTSEKFDPAIFKKPYAFTRSASERRSPPDHRKIGVYKPEHRDKIHKRVSDNIITSKDKNTTYQNYGLIDTGVKPIDTDIARDSNPNLERINEAANPRFSRGIKERPISWNEETSEWLRKKRQAYNMATKKITNEDFENKENIDAAPKRERTDKCTKKSSIVNKLGIFR